MKKIAITTIHPAPYIDLLIKSLANEFDVDIFYVKKNSSEKEWKNCNYINGHLYSDYSFVDLFNILKKNDLVIFAGWNISKNIILCFSLIPFKTKTAFFLDHPIIGVTKTNFIAKLIKHVIIKSTDYIFPASISCKKYLNSTYSISEKKMCIFPYAHSYQSDKIIKINFEREKELTRGAPIRLFIANRFIDRKGYNIIFEALKKLKEINILERYQINIAGSGEDFLNYKFLFNRLSKNINLLGWIENETYETEMDFCDVFLHASLFEPFGIPPLDAMQRGKTVIISDGVKSTNHLISNKTNGIHIYPANDFRELFKVLVSIYEQKSQIYRYSHNTIETVNKNYSIDINIQAIKTALNFDQP